jgi:hypothetical protein
MTVHWVHCASRKQFSLSSLSLSDSLGDAILTGFWYPSIIPVHSRINCTRSRNHSKRIRKAFHILHNSAGCSESFLDV